MWKARYRSVSRAGSDSYMFSPLLTTRSNSASAVRFQASSWRKVACSARPWRRAFSSAWRRDSVSRSTPTSRMPVTFR
ncbi:hypothetical protein ASR50_28115 [Streptomyces sp. 4F]|nr:hypothetical protein ASR50_28115 [Streptomyces sp. 4F]